MRLLTKLEEGRSKGTGNEQASVRTSCLLFLLGLVSGFEDPVERGLRSAAELSEAARENSVANGRFRRDSAECGTAECH